MTRRFVSRCCDARTIKKEIVTTAEIRTHAFRLERLVLDRSTTATARLIAGQHSTQQRSIARPITIGLLQPSRRGPIFQYDAIAAIFAAERRVSRREFDFSEVR
jgi:hypothetical protein